MSLTDLETAAEFSIFVASHRALIGISQEELGRRVHVSQRAISLYEQGARVPSLPIAVRITRALGASMADLESMVSA